MLPPSPYWGRARPRVPPPAPLWDAETLLAAVPDEAWEAVTWREGTKGALTKEFVAVRVHRATGNPDVGTNGRSVVHGRVTTGPAGWLPGERPCPARRATPSGTLLVVAGVAPGDAPGAPGHLAHGRWVVEQFYEDAKGRAGWPTTRAGAGTGCTATWPWSCSPTASWPPSATSPPGPPPPAWRPPAFPRAAAARGALPPAPAADVSGHAPSCPPLALRRPRPLDQGYRSHPPVSHAVLSPLLTK